MVRSPSPPPTRRALIGAVGALGVASVLPGCSGAPSGDDDALAGPGQGRLLRLAQRLDTGGTLFRPAIAARLPGLAFADPSPSFTRIPALYCPSPATAGGSLPLFVGEERATLSEQITHFRELPELYDRAREFGLNALYLADYYEAAPGADPAHAHRNRGEYLPRRDLGGERGLIEGIAAIRERGGQVFLSLDPTVFGRDSAIGARTGERWAQRSPAADVAADPDVDGWRLCPAEPGVAEHFAAVAARLVGTYGAYGVHLTGCGLPAGGACASTEHGHAADAGPEVLGSARAALVERIAAAVRAADPSAVVLCEGIDEAGPFAWAHGGQALGVHALADRWMWRASGRSAAFTCGWSLDDVHQIVAMGHRLALGGSFWLQDPVGERLTAWLDSHLPDPIPAAPDPAARRAFAERFFRAVHRFRNAGLVEGRPMPNVDAITPRPLQGEASFADDDSLRRLMADLVATAPRIDASLRGLTRSRTTLHLRKVLRARIALAPVIDGSTVQVEPIEATGPTAVAYRFDGPLGTAYTAANVGADPVELALPGGNGQFEEYVTRQELPSGSLFVVPAHGIAMWMRQGGA